MKPITPKQIELFASALPETKTGIFGRYEVNQAIGKIDLTYHRFRDTLQKLPQPRKGVYNLSHLFKELKPDAIKAALDEYKLTPDSHMAAAATSTPPVNVASSQTERRTSVEAYIPKIDKTFVRWGAYHRIAKILSSRKWFPTYITGHSGNGKTMMVEQACAKEKREFVRVQITPETDEDDLIGGMRLCEVNGATVTKFVEGPVIAAMRAGAILLLDELDRGSNRIMCLQGILEGKPYMLKKTGEVVTPTPGFNVIATTNTKGRGDANGRYIAASIIDDAFLERFTITIEQPFAQLPLEKRILRNHFTKFGLDADTDENTAHIKQLLIWAKEIRASYQVQGVTDVITTRRLCHIAETFEVFQDMDEAIEICIARFDEDTIKAFQSFWKITKANITKEEKAEAALADTKGDVSDPEF